MKCIKNETKTHKKIVKLYFKVTYTEVNIFTLSYLKKEELKTKYVMYLHKKIIFLYWLIVWLTNILFGQTKQVTN